MPEVWYRNKQFGAHLFDLVRNDDGSFVSTCVGTIPQDDVPKPCEPMHFKIPSNTDPDKDPYDVTVYPDGQITCQCDGFGWRHNCSHCNTVREAIQSAKERL